MNFAWPRPLLLHLPSRQDPAHLDRICHTHTHIVRHTKARLGCPRLQSQSTAMGSMCIHTTSPFFTYLFLAARGPQWHMGPHTYINITVHT